MTDKAASPKPSAGFAGLSGTQLKWIALVSMLIDHTGHMLVKPWTPLYWGMRLFGRLAFPLYAFLLVEGFCHTRNVRRYLGRLGAFALISELPFDIMNRRLEQVMAGLSLRVLGAGEAAALLCTGQNVYFTLFLGLLALTGFVRLQNRGAWAWAVGWCVLMGALAEWLRTDYGWAGVALVCLLYRFQKQPLKRAAFGFGVLLLGVGQMEMTALASFLLMGLYSGERGSDRFKLGFYLFYPVHLLVLAAIRSL
ncbi:MAG: hypothetical protein HFI38_06640 [Lachnospiraceae bacterium]|nr:hypothetical protein [Lachnospiraceae bacterium]